MDTPAGPEVTESPLTPEDVAVMFEREAVRVRRLVRLGVSAPDAVVEDACQTAWMRLLRDPARVRRGASTQWLVRVAVREARRGARRGARDLSLDALEAESGPPAQLATPSVDDLFELRDRLDGLEALPVRQRRLVWLRGLGFTYREMAGVTGDTVRTVQRQLERAGDRLASSDVLCDS